MIAPAFGSLTPTFKKIAFSFAIPTIIFLGALYSVCLSHSWCFVFNLSSTVQSVSSRYIFFRIFRNSEHKHSNSFKAWATWCAIVATTWVGAFVLAEVIPFFSDLLSLMSSLFGQYFLSIPRGLNREFTGIWQIAGSDLFSGEWPILPFILAH